MKLKLLKNFTAPVNKYGKVKTYPKGTIFELQAESELKSGGRGGSDGSGGWCAVFKNDKGIISIGHSRCHNFFAEFMAPPSFEELTEWEKQGVCKSILGEWVEPHGYDQHGMPSWFIVKGIAWS
jgi:hypothetical protein